MLDLLRTRQTGEAVPVLLDVSTWDPRRDHIESWLHRRLIELYPGLVDQRVYGKDATRRLIDRGLILPVLDGLDEMPATLQARAITEIGAAFGAARPLVLTSRATDYELAVHQAGFPLAKAAVVEIDPVAAQDAIQYLSRGQVNGRERWRAVTSEPWRPSCIATRRPTSPGGD